METRLLEYRDSLQSLITQCRHVRDISRCKFDLAVIPWVVIRRARTLLTLGKSVYCINDPKTQQVLFWRVMQGWFALKRQRELSWEHGASLGTMVDSTVKIIPGARSLRYLFNPYLKVRHKDSSTNYFFESSLLQVLVR